MAHPLVEWGYVKPREYEALRELQRADEHGTVRDPHGYAELAVALCKDNLPLFNVLFRNRTPMPFMPGVMAERGSSQFNLVELPRSHSKSDSACIGDTVKDICYAAIHEAPDLRALIVQENATQAEKTVTAIRGELLGAFDDKGPKNLLGYAFGDMRQRVIKNQGSLLWLDLGYDITKDPTVEGVGVGGAITGGHPTKFKGDDMVSYETARTEGQQETMWEWWVTTPSGMFDPGTVVDLFFTPKFERDLHGRLKRTGLFNGIRRPVFNRWPTEGDYEAILNEKGQRIWVRLTPQALGLVDGVEPLRALWPCPQGRCPGPACADGKVPGVPMHRSAEYLIHAKFLPDAYGFATEFMLEHRAKGDTPIKKHMLRFFTFNPAEVGAQTEYNKHPVVAFPRAEDIVLATHGWDHAIGKNKKSDYTALCRMYRDRQNNVYCWVSSGHWDPETVKQMMETQFITDPHRRPMVVVTEALNFQAMFGTGVQEKATTIVPLDMQRRPVDKLAAMVENGYLNHLINGKVYFNIEEPDTIREHLNFDGQGRSGTHDDRVDACRLAFGPLSDYVTRAAEVRELPKASPMLDPNQWGPPGFGAF